MSHTPTIKRELTRALLEWQGDRSITQQETAAFLSGAVTAAHWIAQLEAFGAGHPQTVVAAINELACEIGLKPLDDGKKGEAKT